MKTVHASHPPTGAHLEDGDVWQHTESGERQTFSDGQWAPEGKTSLDVEIDEDPELTDEEKAAEHARLEQERKDFEGQQQEQEQKDNG